MGRNAQHVRPGRAARDDRRRRAVETLTGTLEHHKRVHGPKSEKVDEVERLIARTKKNLGIVEQAKPETEA